MKELSIEEKAKTYDEIIKKAAKMHNENCEACQMCIEELIPELKESEDERIIKSITRLIKAFHNVNFPTQEGFSREDLFAWLEKQGEPTEINPSEFDLRLNKLLKQFETLPKEDLESSLAFYLNVVREGKQGEQKPSNKVEPKFKVGDIIRHKKQGFTCKIDAIDTEYRLSECCGTHLPIDWEDAYELVEQNTAWSEKDETGLTNTIIMLKEAASFRFNKKDITKAVDWLKSLKDRMKGKIK